MKDAQSTYENLLHTRRLSNRTYVRIEPMEADQVLDILSEGAWRITLCWTGDANQLQITFGDGQQMSLRGTGLLDNSFDPSVALVLDGDVNTVRDDQLKVTCTEAETGATLIIIFDRIIWKKDDNFYPAQAEDKEDLAELNAAGLKRRQQ